MSIVIGLVFGIFYVIESVLLFLLGNHGGALWPTIISCVVAIILLVLSNAWAAKLSVSHPHLIYAGLAVAIAILLFVAIFMVAVPMSSN